MFRAQMLAAIHNTWRGLNADLQIGLVIRCFTISQLRLLPLQRPGLPQFPHKRRGPRRFRLIGGIDLPEPGSKGEGQVPQAS